MRFAADTVVVITGSNRGLGFQFAKQLLETTPSTVVATARNPSNADQLNELKQHHGKRLQLISMDTSDEGSVQDAVREVATEHSGIDLLINNAGIEEGMGSIWDTSSATYENILKVNVVGVFITTKAFVPLLKKKQSRTILQVSSIFASVSFNRLGMTNPQKNPAGDKLIAYNASKTAVNMQTSIFANALKDDNFCIIALNPGWNETEMGSKNARALGMEAAPLQPHESIVKMLNVIRKVSAENSGEFLDLEAGEKIDY